MKDHSACMCVCVCSVCVHSSHVLCVPVRVLIIKNKHVSLPVAETLCKANKVVHANVFTAVYSLTVRIKGLFVLFFIPGEVHILSQSGKKRVKPEPNK